MPDPLHCYWGGKVLHHVVQGGVKLGALPEGLGELVVLFLHLEHLCSVTTEHEERPGALLGFF